MSFANATVRTFGQVDDLLLVPLGLALAIRLNPQSILEEHRARAANEMSRPGAASLVGLTVVIVLWSVALLWLLWVIWSLLPA